MCCKSVCGFGLFSLGRARIGSSVLDKGQSALERVSRIPWSVSFSEFSTRIFSFRIAFSQETPWYDPTRPSNPVSQSHLDEFFPCAEQMPWPEHGFCQPPGHSISHMLPVHPGLHMHEPSPAQVPCLEHVLVGPPRHSIPQLTPLYELLHAHVPSDDEHVPLHVLRVGSEQPHGWS